MHIEEMTMCEFQAGLEKTRTVLIPLGSTEEHGSHLPLTTDTMQAVSVARRIADIRPIFIAPPISYGVCRSSYEHSGTLSITTETLKALVLDVADALYRQGLRHLIFLSGHAGGTHMATVTDAGEKLLKRYLDIKVAVLTEYLLAAEAGRHLIETSGDAHAGEIETSRIMNSHPHLVKGCAPREFPSFPQGILVRCKTKFWPGGVWGDPTKASAEKGAKIEDLVVKKLDEFIDRFEAWDELEA
jgi:creatinine amidohydrolase